MENTEKTLVTDVRDGLAGLLNNSDLANAILAIVMILLTALCAKIVTEVLRRLLQRENSPLPQSTIFINIFRVAIWCIGLSLTLSACFGIDVSGIVTALGVGGIAISLGMQDTISNLIGGLQMSLMKTVVPGDHVEISGRRGIVHDITWRQMTVETSNGQTIIVPNSVINNGALVKLPPMEKVIVTINLYKNIPDLDATLHDIEAEVKAALSKDFKITKGPKTQILSVSEYSYTGSFIVWLDPEGLTYAQTDDARDIITRIIAKHSPLI